MFAAAAVITRPWARENINAAAVVITPPPLNQYKLLRFIRFHAAS